MAEGVGLFARGEDQEGAVGAAQRAQLARLLEEASAALREGDLAIGAVLDLLHVHLSPPLALPPMRVFETRRVVVPGLVVAVTRCKHCDN